MAVLLLLVVLLVLAVLAEIGDGWVASGEVGVANEYLRVPNWDAWEADRAPRMAFHSSRTASPDRHRN
jgi:hypothetical protein